MSSLILHQIAVPEIQSSAHKIGSKRFFVTMYFWVGFMCTILYLARERRNHIFWTYAHAMRDAILFFCIRLQRLACVQLHWSFEFTFFHLNTERVQKERSRNRDTDPAPFICGLTLGNWMLIVTRDFDLSTSLEKQPEENNFESHRCSWTFDLHDRWRIDDRSCGEI